MNKYQAFLKVVECGSFTEAADELNYTQSAVSQMILTLEKELGTPLFIRSRHSLQLTYEGEQLLPLMRRLVNDYRELNDRALALKGLEAGIVRMAAFGTFSGSLLPHILKEFKKDYPNVIIELHQGYYREIEQWVEKDVVDFGITNIDGIKKYQTRKLFDDPLFVVVPKHHPWAMEKKIPLEKLQEEVFVVLDEGDEKDYLNRLEKMDISLNIHYRLCDDNSILSMVENGLGIAILPQLAILAGRHDLAQVRLEPSMKRSIGVILKQKKQLLPITEIFLRYVEKSTLTIETQQKSQTP